MGYETIRFAIEAGVATITLDRPEVRNGLNAAMRREIRAATAEAARGAHQCGRVSSATVGQATLAVATDATDQ